MSKLTDSFRERLYACINEISEAAKAEMMGTVDIYLRCIDDGRLINPVELQAVSNLQNVSVKKTQAYINTFREMLEVYRDGARK